jgi:flagellar biogenesis protein FliO
VTAFLGEPIAVVSLAVALGGVLFLLHGWRRTRQTVNTGERIELVTSRYLGGKKVLTLVDVEGERLLLALSGDSVRLVARLASRDHHCASPAATGENHRVTAGDCPGCTGEATP